MGGFPEAHHGGAGRAALRGAARRPGADSATTLKG